MSRTKQRIPKKTQIRRRSIPWWLGESRMRLAQLVPSLQHCQWGCVPECNIHEWLGAVMSVLTEEPRKALHSVFCLALAWRANGNVVGAGRESDNPLILKAWGGRRSNFTSSALLKPAALHYDSYVKLKKKITAMYQRSRSPRWWPRVTFHVTFPTCCWRVVTPQYMKWWPHLLWVGICSIEANEAFLPPTEGNRCATSIWFVFSFVLFVTSEQLPNGHSSTERIEPFEASIENSSIEGWRKRENVQLKLS